VDGASAGDPMLRGTVTSEREAIIAVSVRGPTGRVLDTEAVVDTGFDGYLCLPPTAIAQLRLPWIESGEATLADGSDCLVEVYQGTVLWDGHALSLLVDEVDTDPLVGMGLLEGHELKIEVRPGGKVTIKRLPRRRRA
jgi:clan AA aspartic protease